LPPQPTKNWFLRHKVLYSVIGVLVVAICAAVVYWPNHQPGEDDAHIPIFTPRTFTSSWKTYTDSQIGYSLDYPSDWTTSTKPDQPIVMISSPLNEVQFIISNDNFGTNFKSFDEYVKTQAALNRNNLQHVKLNGVDAILNESTYYIQKDKN